MYRMEISKVILSESLIASPHSSFHVELKKILQTLRGNSIKDIINKNNNGSIAIIDRQINEVLNKALHYNHKLEKEKINEFAQIIFTINEYLKEGVSKADVKTILCFLSVNCYLKIDIKKLLSDKELEEKYLHPISKKLLQLLLNTRSKILLLPNAPYHEKKMMEESLEGFKKNNIKNTYRLIESIERGGGGFRLNYLLENLITFLHDLNYSYFLKAISDLSNPYSFVFYLQNFNRKEILQLTNETTLNNKWLNFELIRQIIGKAQKDSLEKNECSAINCALSKIHFEDFDYLKQTIRYFHSYSLFNAALGEFLTTLTDSQIQEIITECFKINKYNFHLKVRNLLLEYFNAKASVQQQKIFLKTTYNKWKLFYGNSCNSEDFYQNDLLLTDFAHFIVNYYSLITTDSELLKQIKILIDRIKNIDSEWTVSTSQQMTKFHLFHSLLYLLSFAYNNKKLNSKEIRESFNDIEKNNIQKHRYFSKTEIEQLNKIAANFNGLNSKSLTL